MFLGRQCSSASQNTAKLEHRHTHTHTHMRKAEDGGPEQKRWSKETNNEKVEKKNVNTESKRVIEVKTQHHEKETERNRENYVEKEQVDESSTAVD